MAGNGGAGVDSDSSLLEMLELPSQNGGPGGIGLPHRLGLSMLSKGVAWHNRRNELSINPSANRTPALRKPSCPPLDHFFMDASPYGSG